MFIELITTSKRHATIAESILAYAHSNMMITPPAIVNTTELVSSRQLPYWHYLIAFTVGAANTLSFAPTPHGGWLEIAIFAFFYLWLTRTINWKSAALTAWAFEFGNLMTGIHWLYISMHFYGGMPAPIAGAVLVLFSLYLSFYPALAASTWFFCVDHQHTCNKNSNVSSLFLTWNSIFTFSSTWALGEWLRGTIFTGFPWLASGYAQVNGPLAGFAPIVGVYGVGWMLAFVAALIVQTITHIITIIMLHKQKKCNSIFPKRPSLTGIVASAVIVVGLIAAGLLLSFVTWTVSDRTLLHVRLLQGNVRQETKFEKASMLAAIEKYRQMITAKPANLIVSPETAIPMLVQEMPDWFTVAIRQFADSTGTAILFGAFGCTVSPDGYNNIDYTNSLIGVIPGSGELYRYNKHHLVPFGEFVPRGFKWFISLMNIPLGNLARGTQIQKPFIVHNQTVAANICYEDIFGEEIARNLRKNKVPANMLINSTNLAWFGNTIALEQHLQIARMRSLETGRPMLCATNTGITAAIDAHGNVIARMPVSTVGSIDVDVQGTVGFTPYVTHGNNTVLAISTLLTFWFFFVGHYTIATKRSTRTKVMQLL